MSPNRSACTPGYGPHNEAKELSEWFWESQPKRVKASYDNNAETGGIRSTAGHVKPCRKAGGPPPKAKYYPVTDRETVL